MDNLRKYEAGPFEAAVIHGGPGGAGQMAPVARELSKSTGILEPLQTAPTIAGQVAELMEVLENNTSFPVTLIGHSWGALLSSIAAAEHSSKIKKLILISAPPFEEKYVNEIIQTRFHRMNNRERLKAEVLTAKLGEPEYLYKNEVFAQLGEVAFNVDSYDPLVDEDEAINYQYEIFRRVWGECEALRKNGKLIEFAKRIVCPVVAIHGDYDPHPVRGVDEPLSHMLKDYRLIVLEKCGHYPWLERHAKALFYDILKDVMA